MERQAELIVVRGCAPRCSLSASLGEWSAPQSPVGGLRGKKRKSSHLNSSIYVFIRANLKAQAQPATGSRAS